MDTAAQYTPDMPVATDEENQNVTDIGDLRSIFPDLPEGESMFLNRELTWLEFNRRVLHEAADERTPLLERCAFLAIFNSNLDEFFQKRVGGLKQQIATGISRRSPDGLLPQETLAAIRQLVLPMLDEQARLFTEELKPRLEQHNIYIKTWDQLSDDQRQAAQDYFEQNLFSMLTPLAVDPGHPFPFISNLSTSLGVMIKDPRLGNSGMTDEENIQFARVKVPQSISRWVPLSQNENEEGYTFVHLMEVIKHNLPRLFAGMDIQEVEPFRITRNAAVERDEEDAEDLLEMIEQELRDRRFAEAIRLEVDNDPHLPMNEFLKSELRLNEEDIYQMPGQLDYNDMWQIHKVDMPELKHPSWTPTVPPAFSDQDADIFSIIRHRDVLVHHPYESFAASVERFIAAAARDPKVMTIKCTLYRTAEDSPFIPELIRAAERGKQVVVLVELKARFDEERNVALAQQLEGAGVHVVYGLVGYKTHTKTALVVRQEPDRMRCYAHIGTGNYHSKTANLYTDLGLFTADPRLTDDLVQLFHHLTGRSARPSFDHLLVAPFNMRETFIQKIRQETANCEAWKERGADPDDPDRPSIEAKMNQLEDRAICRELYEASQAGVKIRLIVRGFCCLRPGVPGLSENISVISVIGRFLEHSRIFRFQNDGDPLYFIGSADWMYRNLSNRVECITPIYDRQHQGYLQQILDIMFKDYRQAWEMHADGTYTQRSTENANPDNRYAVMGTHAALMDLTRRVAKRQREQIAG